MSRVNEGTSLFFSLWKKVAWLIDSFPHLKAKNTKNAWHFAGCISSETIQECNQGEMWWRIGSHSWTSDESKTVTPKGKRKSKTEADPEKDRNDTGDKENVKKIKSPSNDDQDKPLAKKMTIFQEIEKKQQKQKAQSGLYDLVYILWI
jgi:hypothetical protein